MVRPAVLLLVVGLVVTAGCGKKTKKSDPGRPVREQLAAELRPVALSNCQLRRFGSVNDGGYLLCENLIKGVESAYSYGIEHEDNFGCVISKEFGVGIHQYDCFTEDRPTCPGGTFVFHDECVGVKAETIEGNLFDSLTGQIEKNGDRGKRLIMKIDVEGAEWDSLLSTSDEVLGQFDQLAMELHGVDNAKYVEVLKKLKKTFHLVSLHFNNYACSKKKFAPLPADAYQVLFVNKRLGVVDPNGAPRVSGSPPDAPDNGSAADCQSLIK